MSVLHQMGHLSDNLLTDVDLSEFSGAILSPVNYTEEKVIAQVSACRSLDGFRVIFDPQLYFPNSERGQLPSWSYFPSDVETADLGTEAWWKGVAKSLSETAEKLRPDAVCSPAVVPRTYEDAYYEIAVMACETVVAEMEGMGIGVLQTAVVGLPDLTMKGRPLAIASILTRAPVDEVFLVLVGNTEPRRELRDAEEIKGAMRLIKALEGAGVRVTVGFCSSDVVLWKHAGAAACSTGKFFNLRRFTRARFDEPGGGGGQLPYWFEESLLAFLRESDLVRVRKAGLLSDASRTSPFGQEILQLLDTAPGSAWVGKSWRQYLWWFADIERRIASGAVDVPTLLKTVETTWQSIDDKILMEEPTNNGVWLRAWRRACVEMDQ